MKRILLFLVIVLSFNLLALDISGSRLEYNSKFSNANNYLEKDGTGVLKVNVGDLSLKYSADIKNGQAELDTTMEALYQKTLKNRVRFSVDATLDTENGLQFKLDDDSNKTNLKWGLTEDLILAIYPFNLGTTVGNSLETEEVAKVYFLSGRPTVVSGESQGVDLMSKTVPGMVATYRMNKMMRAYAGLGAVEYDYPGNEGFDLTENTKAYSWQKRVALTYKAGFEYDNEISKLSFNFVGQDESEKGGSLLKYAAAVDLVQYLGDIRISAEGVYTQAGDNPYYVENGDISAKYGYEPYYKQDWVGQGDFGGVAKLDYELFSGVKPYVSGKYLGANFIYDGEDSAHKLRTRREFDPGFNESDSHGGLTVVEGGVENRYFDAIITPYFKYKMATNAVFSPESDLTAKADKRTEDLEKTCYTFGLNIKYNF